ncbi:glycosyltransferase [Desulfobacter latus]|uniref:Glycosyltransferase n=1 Tax=Desulfobacter latus TaxID=2292 RepID=A0A850SPQ4_9BACT|nr:glycosyltransferase [Desulfobacter latus]NWH03454.1 glycosyltransferase [Desulfobacter latus]
MNIIFVHPNFPAQFRHLAKHLGGTQGNRVIFLTANPRPEWKIPGVEKLIFREPDSTDPGQNMDPGEADARMRHKRGQAVAALLMGLKKKGFKPDLMIGHSGWGATLYLKDIFPHTPFLGYFEWYYDAEKPNATFGRKSPPSAKSRMDFRNRSMSILSDLAACDMGLCPTLWQKAQFPKAFHHKLMVVHDGIDTDVFKPAENKNQKLNLPGLNLPPTGPGDRDIELVTYTTRGFEPYRGFPQFVEAIPDILDKRPRAHIVLVGEDRVCYGPRPPKGRTFKTIMEKRVTLDPSRVHFLDPLPYGEYRRLLQASQVHVYLTVPFVLSWSMLEAMATGCLVAASDTPPVREVIRDGYNGILTDFFSPADIAQKVCACLEYPSFMESIKQKARQTVLEKYDLRLTLARQMELVQQLSAAPAHGRRFG